MPWRARKSLAKALLPSSCAAAAVGPKMRWPAARKRSTTPATSGCSGPTTVTLTPSRSTRATRPSRSVAPTSTLRHFASVAVPALPGATSTCETRGDCASFHANACSRPPPPMTRTFIGSVPEVPDAGEHHGDAVFVGRGDHFAVAHRATRLDHGLDAGFGRGVDAVAEWEEGIRGHHRTGHDQAGVGGLDAGDTRRIHATHLARADADGAAVLRVDDRVGLDERGHAPGEQQVAQLRVGRRDPGYYLQLVARHFADVAGLHQQARADALDVEVVAALAMRNAQHAHVGFLLRVGQGV